METQTKAIEASALYRIGEIYSTPQQHGRLKLCKTTVFALVKSGALPTVKIGGGRATFVRGADLLKLFEVA